MTTPTDDAMGLIKALGFVAWADERIAPQEKEMLSTVMDSLEIPDERRAELCAMVCAGPPELDHIAELFSDETERRFAMAQAIMLAQADGEVAASERREISALAKALEIPDEELQVIYAAVDVTMKLVPPPSVADLGE